MINYDMVELVSQHYRSPLASSRLSIPDLPTGHVRLSCEEEKICLAVIDENQKMMRIQVSLNSPFPASSFESNEYFIYPIVNSSDLLPMF